MNKIQILNTIQIVYILYLATKSKKKVNSIWIAAVWISINYQGHVYMLYADILLYIQN